MLPSRSNSLYHGFDANVRTHLHYRCFGLLLTPGRNVKQSDMHLLDMERVGVEDTIAAGAAHSVTGVWDPSHPHFTLLNTETQKGLNSVLRVFLIF